jgi:large subunit ribosomal protein L35
MPKMKTHSGTKDRVKVTGSGKLRRMKAGRKAGAAFASTPMRGRKHRRRRSGTAEVSNADSKQIRRLLGR